MITNLKPHQAQCKSSNCSEYNLHGNNNIASFNFIKLGNHYCLLAGRDNISGC